MTFSVSRGIKEQQTQCGRKGTDKDTTKTGGDRSHTETKVLDIE